MRHADDYLTRPPSERNLVASAIAKWMNESLFLDNVAESDRMQHGRCYNISAFRKGSFALTVYVYSPEYIRVSYATHEPDMPDHEVRLYGSKEDALAFMNLAFNLGQPVEAMAVPQKIVKSRQKKSSTIPRPEEHNVTQEAAEAPPRSFIQPDFFGGK